MAWAQRPGHCEPPRKVLKSPPGQGVSGDLQSIAKLLNIRAGKVLVKLPRALALLRAATLERGKGPPGAGLVLEALDEPLSLPT